MKKMKNKWFLGLSVIAMFLVVGPNKAQAQNEQVSFQLFYDELAPYGEWIDDQDYGYVWLPDVGSDFQPYATNGRWVNTEYGNTWYSDYDWGWAPFHYGRWHFNDRYGWGWVPGYEWGPAWVSWRQGGGQYGWAPMGPNVSVGVHINIPLRHWIFVPQRYFFSPGIYAYYTPYSRYNRFYNRTVVINNTYIYNNRTYYAGPSRRDLARSTRGNVPVYRLNDSRRPGRASINNRTVSIYRPSVNQNSRATSRPSRVADVSAVKTAGNAGSNGRPNAVVSSSRPSRTEQTSVSRPAAVRKSNTAARPNAVRNTTQRSNTQSSKTVRAQRSVPASSANSRSVQRSETTTTTRSTPAARTSQTRPVRTTPSKPAVSRPATSSSGRAAASKSSSVQKSAPVRSTTVRASAPARSKAPARSSTRSSSRSERGSR